MKPRVVALVLVITAGLSPSCAGAPVTSAELPGKYTLSSMRAEEVLLLSPDGNYEHAYTLRGGTAYHTAGAWEFDNKNHRIVFSKFVSRWRQVEYPQHFPSLEEATEAYWSAPVERSWDGKIRIVVSHDFDRYFVRE